METSFRNEALNLRFFEKLLKPYGHQKDIDSWYLKSVQPRMMNGGGIDQIKFDQVQYGGTIVDIKYRGQIYFVDIQHLITEDDVGFVIENIKFMHIKDTNPFHRCAFIQVNKKDRVAYIMHITKDFPCFTKDRQARELFDDVKEQTKYGDLLMKSVIAYCRKNKDKLNIDRLQLSDVSAFVCKRQEILLERARQLMGDYPYYMKFGFTSIDPDADAILDHNRKIMSSILAGDAHVQLPLIIRANVDGTKVDTDQMLALVNSNLDQRLIKVMKMIFNWNCSAFYYIYDAVFRAVGLLELEGDASEYELYL